MKRPGLIAIAAILVFSGVAGAGVVYEIEVRQAEGEPAISEMSVEGQLLRMGVNRGGAPSAIELVWRGDRREAVIINHEEQYYSVLDEEALTRLTGQLGQALGGVQEMLRNLPESQRGMVEQMMKDKLPNEALPQGALEVVRTDETQTHNGYPCVKYIINVDGLATRELWVTNWGRIKGGDQLGAVLEGMVEFFSGFLDSLGGMTGGIPGLGEQLNAGVITEMGELDGFPVVARGFDSAGDVIDEAVLRSVTERDLDPAAFEPPEGYRPRTLGLQ